QADEQQHLLSNIITQGSLHRKPLPKFWFLPRKLKAVVVMTGDDHANGGTVERFNRYLTLSGPNNTPQDVLDWKAIRSTSYIYTSSGTGIITPTLASTFESQGFEIAAHIFTNCSNWTSQSNLENFYTTQLAEFAGKWPGVSSPTTNRTHCLAWSDWATQPKVERLKGIRLDANYYYWPGSWIQNRPGMFTGSGMPMRFADLDGSLIDCFQVTTQMPDESGIQWPGFINTLLDNAIGANGYYGVFCANMHTDVNTPGDQSVVGSEAVIASAIARQVPVISARQMLQWLDGRNASNFNTMNWSGNTLSFTISNATNGEKLQAMVPVSSASGSLIGINRIGVPVTYTTEVIKGINYAFFDASNGEYTANYTPDEIFPVELISIRGNAIGSDVRLEWSTASESNNRGFEVQRSLDGRNWQDIGFVPGAGNSVTFRNYSFLDKNLPANKYFYRLTQIDFDGRFTYSNIITISLNSNNGYILDQNYPNPFNNSTMIGYSLPKATHVQISMYDLQGRVIKVLEDGMRQAGKHTLQVNTYKLSHGVYYYKMKAGDFTETKKMVVR
ncbi:MAG: T9SS type A sorting domain-containing protein, partial [Chitinophagaceae bacterium]